MNRKISVGVCISLMTIACTVAFVVTWTVSFNRFNKKIPGAVKRDEISSKLHEIDSYIQNNFLGEINEESIAYGIFSGYTSGVGDENTRYMTAEEYIRHSNETKGQLVTCGVKAEKEESGYIKVTEVYPGSFAESQGVLKGDVITVIDGVNVLEAGADVAIRLLEGAENTRVPLTIQREGEVIEHSLVRQAMDIVSIESAVVNNVGIIRISTFNLLTSVQFNAALQEFVEGGVVKALMLDIRGSSSDVYTPVRDMVNNFVGANTVAYSEYRNDVRKELIVTDDTMLFSGTIPIVILTDMATSGAGELMAAVLKSHAGAQIVGEVTAGNAYIQETKGLRDGSAIKVTVAQIILSDGFEYAGTGLPPDFVIESELDNAAGTSDMTFSPTDPQYQKAFEILETSSNERRYSNNNSN